MGAAILGFARQHIEETVQTAQSLLKCRSLEDVMSVRNSYLQQSFDRLINHASKMTQNAVHLAKEKTEPLSNQVEKFVEGFKKGIA